MRPTLKDIAQKAGVSTATVSYVLNNGPRPVSIETRERVLRAAKQLGYKPRHRRKAGAESKSYTVGVIVPNANSEFFGSALEGIETFLYSRGHDCLVGSSHSDMAIEKNLISKLSRLVDGLIITPVRELYPEIEQLPEMGLPTIIMDRQVQATSLSGVGVDNYNITVQAVRLLYETGHERLALLNGLPEIDPVRYRLNGYQDSLAVLGLPYNQDYVLHVPFTIEAGRGAALDLMSLPQPPDAIICTSTDLTIGTLRSLYQLGCRLPDDVGLVCYGDSVWAPLFTPPITVIDAPTQLMGETSARLLLNSFSDKGDREKRHIFLETKPILRDSHRRQHRPAEG